MPIFGRGVAVAALELWVRDLRTDLNAMQPAVIVAARSLSRELATCRPFGRQALTPEPRPVHALDRHMVPAHTAAQLRSNGVMPA